VQSIYISLMVGCAVFYLLTILFGGDHHHGDFGHHVDLGHHGGGAHHHHDGGSQIKQYLSIRSILLFGLGFGVAGSLSTALGLAAFLIPIVGIMTGIGFAWFGLLLFRILLKQEGTTSSDLAELEGYTGKIITAIPEGGVGEISIINLRNEAQYLRARSEDGASIRCGESVEVVSVVAGDVVVKKTPYLRPVN